MPYRYNANKINRFLRRRHLPHGPKGGENRNPSALRAAARRWVFAALAYPTPAPIVRRAATTYQRAELLRSSYSCKAAVALPRRGASPMTLRTRTPPWSATVTTSPHLTSRPGATTRAPLTRTCPTMASDAAALRVRTIRAFHSHRSIRCRSADTRTVASAALLGVRL